MRTTVDLPPSVHRRVADLAKRRRQSLSATLADLTARGLSTLDEPSRLVEDPVTGLLVLEGSGRTVTPEDVAALLDDE